MSQFENLFRSINGFQASNKVVTYRPFMCSKNKNVVTHILCQTKNIHVLKSHLIRTKVHVVFILFRMHLSQVS